MGLQPIHNFNLRALNTFGLDVRAEKYLKVTTENELEAAMALVALAESPLLILGGGSNLLFTADVSGWVLHIAIEGIELVSTDSDSVLLEVGAGVAWHDFVRYTVERGWSGLENLALIPGTVGASPIQNIGAYGAEISQVLESVTVFDRQTNAYRTFQTDGCDFGYRTSIFKQAWKGRAIITHVRFRLSSRPRLNLSYGTVKQELAAHFPEPWTPANVADTVEAIRRSKLPDPAVLGNAGSFFKNPVVTVEDFMRLVEACPTIPNYPQSDGSVKVPAAWLIEQCGWKGKRVGNVGCHATQPLVLVNYGGATGAELMAHARAVQQSVWERFHVRLEPEVNLYPS
jgi:UDP-N-acetylmuramate dehydrogenase